MTVIPVAHAAGRYDVIVDPGAVARLPDLCTRLLPGRRLALLTDDHVQPLLAGWLGRADWPAATVAMPPGEAHKTRETWAALTDRLFELGFGRDSALVAAGGGVVGDVAGFVAATFARGIPVVQVPTTLLAMLDASVGGKTGVDTPHGKNLVGAFHQPAAVVADPLTLRTLPAREFRAGLAEAVKHGLIADAAYLDWIAAHRDALLALEADALAHLVARSVAIKADHVTRDERESGPRAMLNAGHTVAHAIEHASGYGLLHGEAVAIGLVAECHLGEAIGALPRGTAPRVAEVLAALGLPTRLPAGLAADALLAAMRHDKKNRAGVLRFALPERVGASRDRDGAWTVPAGDAEVLAALAAVA